MARKNVIVVNGDHNGDVGTVISGNTGPVALNGDIHIGDASPDQKETGRRSFSGTGMTVIEGDNHGTISRSF